MFITKLGTEPKQGMQEIKMQKKQGVQLYKLPPEIVCL